MGFECVSGHESIKTCLRNAIQTGSLHHTLLFCGPPGIGKSALAHALAAELLGRTGAHPDLHLYQPEGKSGTHSIESLRALIEEVRKPPFEARRKVFLIEEADRMFPVAAHALLKTLEEPELDSTIILITHKPHELLPTLLSRCMRVDFAQSDSNCEAVRPEERLVLDALEGKIPCFQAIEEIEALWEGRDHGEIAKTLGLLLTGYLAWLRKRGCSEVAFEEGLSKASKIREALERNVNALTCLHYMLYTT